jgi:CspA family cold shock protein
MERGTIARLVRDRGFGFLRTENGTEVFFHSSALPGGLFDTLAEGQTLEFETEPDPRGRGHRARDVKLAEPP